MYYVVGDGGAKYGPADLPTLKQWASENRILPTMMLEDASTGVQLLASQVPGLFESVPGPAAGYQTPSGTGPLDQGTPPAGTTPDPGQTPGGAPGPYSQPGPYGQPGAPTQSGGPYSPPGGAPTQTGPYSQPGPSSPYSQSPYGSSQAPGPYNNNPYVRPSSSGQDPGPFVIAGWIMAPATLFCCLCLAPVGIFCGWKADKEGHSQGKTIMYINIAAFVLGLILNIVMAASNPALQQIMRGGAG